MIEDYVAQDTQVSVLELEASIYRDSFYEFVKAFWGSIIMEEPIYNWHLKVICDTLQEAAERVFRNEPAKHDVLINIPPGTTKSTICSIMFPAWLWTRMPSCRIISASHTFSLAVTMSRKSREILTSDLYKKLFPDIHLKEDQNQKHHYENTAGGFRYAAGIDGKFTGYHAHIVIVDDPLDPEEALSEKDLGTANRVVSQTLPTRKVSKLVSFLLLIMQRLHQNDPSAVMLADAKTEEGTAVKHLNLPGSITEEGIARSVRPRKLKKNYVRGLLDPVRMTRKSLNKLRSPNKLGDYGYAGQILQTPVPPGGGMFKTKLIIPGLPPPRRHFKSLVRYWDKAGTQDAGCKTAGVLLGIDAQDNIWVLDSITFQHDSWRREEIVKATAQADATICGDPLKTIVGVEQEPGSGGKESAQSTVRRLKGFRVRTTRPTGDKVIRADPFSVQVNAGQVRIAQGPWNDEYLEELKYFPFSSFKDQVDATSGAFEILTRPVTRAGGMW